MEIEKTLDSIHASTVKRRILRLFTVCVRILLGISFIPPSIPKIMHRPFTLLPTTDPVGHYFDALYKTGFYYDFIGWSQLTAVILLLIPRTSHIGALLFFPIIINITVLTNSVGFQGTWLVTLMMSAACLYLVCWDYPRWKSILFSPKGENAGFTTKQLVAIPFALSISGLGLYSAAIYLLGAGSVLHQPRTFLVISSFSFLFGLAVSFHLKFMGILTASTMLTDGDSSNSRPPC